MPMEVDAINQVADGRKQMKQVTFDCRRTNFLTTEGVSVEDRSKRAETARPPRGEQCESQFVCDS